MCEGHNRDVHGILWLIGVAPTPQGTSAMYQLWSGFIPALAILSLAGSMWAHFKRLNCHVRRCWRIGRYDVGPYKVCHRHHPDDKVTRSGVDQAHVTLTWAAERLRR